MERRLRKWIVSAVDSDWKSSDRALLGWAVLTGLAAGLFAVLLKFRIDFEIVQMFETFSMKLLS